MAYRPKKTGFGKETFLKAFHASGVSVDISKKLIYRMCSFKEEWEKLIKDSFLPDEMKNSYSELIQERTAKLS